MTNNSTAAGLSDEEREWLGLFHSRPKNGSYDDIKTWVKSVLEVAQQQESAPVTAPANDNADDNDQDYDADPYQIDDDHSIDLEDFLQGDFFDMDVQEYFATEQQFSAV